MVRPNRTDLCANMWYWQVWEGGRREEREKEYSKEANQVISSVQVKLHDT